MDHIGKRVNHPHQMWLDVQRQLVQQVVVQPELLELEPQDYPRSDGRKECVTL
jgi:hypothetical protein